MLQGAQMVSKLLKMGALILQVLLDENPNPSKVSLSSIGGLPAAANTSQGCSGGGMPSKLDPESINNRTQNDVLHFQFFEVTECLSTETLVTRVGRWSFFFPLQLCQDKEVR